MCSHTYTCSHVCAHVCINVHEHGGQRLTLGALLNHSLSYILRQDLSLKPRALLVCLV